MFWFNKFELFLSNYSIGWDSDHVVFPAKSNILELIEMTSVLIIVEGRFD